MTNEKKSDFYFGVDDIDKQHYQLLDHMSALRDGIANQDGKRALEKVLSYLRLYTESHFVFEEKLMALHHYPALAEHVELHKVFNENLAKLDGDIKSGQTVDANKVLIFIHDWLINHINVEDRKYVPYLKNPAQ